MPDIPEGDEWKIQPDDISNMRQRDGLKSLAQQLADYYQALVDTGMPDDLCYTLVSNLQDHSIRVVRLNDREG